MLVPSIQGPHVLPSYINRVVAAFIPIAVCAALLLPSPTSGVLWWLALAGDYGMALELLLPVIKPFVRSNLSYPKAEEEAADPGLHACRASSALGLLLLVLRLVVHTLGRTTLVLLAGIRLLIAIQASCWLSVLVQTLQPNGALPWLPHSIEWLLSASPLELLDHLRAILAAPRPQTTWPVTLGDLLWYARTLAPVVILPDEHREEALKLLPSSMLDALAQPLLAHLPPKAKQLIGPWANAEGLRLRHGLPPSGEAAASEVTQTGAASPEAQGSSLTPAPTEYEPYIPTPEGILLPRETMIPRLAIPIPPRDGQGGSAGRATPVSSANSSRAHTPRAHHTPARAAIRSPTAAPPSVAGAPHAPHALAPEMLLFRMAAAGMRRVAHRTVEHYRQIAAGLSGALYARALHYAGGPARMVRAVGGVVVSGVRETVGGMGGLAPSFWSASGSEATTPSPPPAATAVAIDAATRGNSSPTNSSPVNSTSVTRTVEGLAAAAHPASSPASAGSSEHWDSVHVDDLLGEAEPTEPADGQQLRSRVAARGRETAEHD